jgi:TRAP-type C4-dicarboxylate transport system permease small subunit
MNLDRGFVGRSMYRTADTLGFPMAWVAVAVPIAAGVIFVHLASRLAGDRTGVLPPSED